MRSPASDIRVSVFARTDTGLQRSGNEDAFLVADLTTGKFGLGPDVSTHRIGERGSLMVVSDGMGGAAAGEIASEMAVNVIRESLMDLRADLDVGAQLDKATETANLEIWNYARENRQFAGMGATLTAVLVHETAAYIAQVGDSRAYLIRGSRIKQLTRDQSLVQALLDSGAIAPEQADSVPHNYIIQALGAAPTVEVAMARVELCSNDHLVVCSDGLSNKLTAEEMRQVVEEADNPTSACRRMVEMANERGGEDNITVIVARFDGAALHSAGQSNSITGSFTVLSEGCFNTDLTGMPDKKSLSDIADKPAEKFTTMALKAISPADLPAPQAQSQTTAERSPAEKPGPAVSPRGARKNYLIVIAGLILLLLAVAGYLFYRSNF
jgi:serine/threonine protein phosphatase PrpC